MENTPETVSPAPDQKLKLNLDLRWVCVALLAVIVAMIVIWKPWHSPIPSNTRTINVTGSANLKATPDEYVFNPSYQFSSLVKATAIAQAESKSTEVVNSLKKLGVSDKNIKTDVNGYQTGGAASFTDTGSMPIKDQYGNNTYTLHMTITVNNRALAQKVQDYITTTTPTGSVTPMPNFSESLRKQLESKARDTATKEARSKADQSARNLGFKVSGVKSVNDGTGFGGSIDPIEGSGIVTDLKAPASTLSIQPGENNLSYSVTVVYYIK